MLLPHVNRSKVPPPSGGSGGSGWGGTSSSARPRPAQQHRESTAIRILAALTYRSCRVQ
jgi:hypothetical protein